MFLRPHAKMLSSAKAAAFLVAALCSLFTLLQTAPAQAMKIQKVVSSKGIEAWLVEDRTLPLIAMQFGFNGGTSQDPEGKEGLGYFVSGMMDEGAGDIRSQDFQERMEELAVDMSFDANRDVMTGGIKTLTKNKDEAFRLLKLALTVPRMDEDAVERVREQILTIIKIDQENPENVASEAWFRKVFAGHPYGKTTKGTLESIRTVTPDDLKGFVKRNFARDNLHVAVVGDISADELSKALDDIFGGLPGKAELKPVEDVKWNTEPKRTVMPMAIPQTVINFGQRGPKRKDDDFIAAYVLNYIVGGGGFASILTEEVREKRGLAYSVYTYLSPLDHTGIFFGGVATENKRAGESLQVIKDVLKRIAADGPTAEEVENAKRYLTGSYALRFSSSTRIADILLWLQIEDLGIDYIDKRNGLIEAVTMDEIKRAAAKWIKPDDLVITIVGEPDGMMPAKSEPASAPSSPRG
ncbi:MAG: insulinase family protein [Rhodomicrobium sp.]|nr:insulinase family protein [Rhodomicrobium sp.]